MTRKSYGTFKLGRRGKRGRARHDEKWIQRSRCRHIADIDSIAFWRRSQWVPHEVTITNDNIAEVDDVEPCEESTVFAQQVFTTEEEQPEIFCLEEPAPEDIPDDDVTFMGEMESGESGSAHEDFGGASRSMDAVQNGNEVVYSSTCANIRSVWQRLCRWQNILGFWLLNGTGCLSREQYQVVHVLINRLIKLRNASEPALPASSTVRRSVQPTLQGWGFVESQIRKTIVNPVRSGSRVTNYLRPNIVSFVVVVPSAWSEMDVSFKATWDILKRAADSVHVTVEEPIFSTIETVPMVANKDLILDVASYIVPTSLNDGSVKSPLLLSDCYSNPILTIHFQEGPSFPTAALNGMDAVFYEFEGTSILRSASVLSVLIKRQDQESMLSLDSDAVPRSEILNGSLFKSYISTGNMWRVGDVCTVLKASRDTEFIFILVQQHLRRRGVPQVMEVLCIPIEEVGGGDGSDDCILNFEKMTRRGVSDVSISCPNLLMPNLLSPKAVPSFGILQDGRAFYVDNILLYSDGFSQYNFKQGSAGGIYALSLNYPVELRRSRQRVRVLALTPPGVSTMEGFRSVIDDLVESSTKGRTVINADGEEILLFTNVVAYVADYHETGHALDVMGQTGKAPCHLCAFLRYKGHPSTASQYAYSTLIHSSDTCFARMGLRTQFVRDSDVNDDDLVEIGLNREDEAIRKNSPLYELANKLRASARSADIPLTEEGRPVVNPKFDPYRSVVVSPDHVLFGVATNALNFTFCALPSNARRRQVDMLIAISLRRNGLQQESQIFNINTSTLHSASISTRFSTLLVSPEIFKEMFDYCERCGETSYAALPSLSNLTKLRNLVTSTYWFPNVSVDKKLSVLHFNSNGGREHLAKLEEICQDYVRNLNEICKTFPQARTQLDKPNVHRVLELYKHSIPALGHVRNFAELVFETAHQPLKRAMLRSNFRDSHIQSSRACIADDWKRRVVDILNFSFDDEENRENELIRMICGRNKDVITAISRDPTMLKDASTLLESHYLSAIANARPSNFNNMDSQYKWILSDLKTGAVVETELMESVKEIRELSTRFLVEEGNREVRVFSRASRTKVFSCNGRMCLSNPSGHDIVRRNTVLQAWIQDEESPCLCPSQSPQDHHCCMAYFAVDILINFSSAGEREVSHGAQSYAAVRKCKLNEEGLIEIGTCTSLQLLPLTNTVRRVCLIHACENDRKLRCFSSSQKNSPCDASILLGHRFHYYDRERGFPPRMA